MDQSHVIPDLRAAFFDGHGKTGPEDCTEAELQEYRALLAKLDDALFDEVMAASRARRRFHTPEQREALRREAEEDAAEGLFAEAEARP
jgi:succinate dehydrogenase flavin-adding protein (antitoxin of CptAB toxin-antitoxin module)